MPATNRRPRPRPPHVQVAAALILTFRNSWGWLFADSPDVIARTATLVPIYLLSMPVRSKRSAARAP